MAAEQEILDLIDQAETRAFERSIQQLERIVDVGDRLLAQQAVGELARTGADVDVAESELNPFFVAGGSP